MRKLRKGFTIVELVIVIAVIAVLTAVLVPTFVHLSKKAKAASDQSLVANLNTALKMAENDNDPYEGHVPSKENETMHDAVLDLEAYGYGLGQLVTKSDEDLVYSIEENKFYLSNDASVDSSKKYNYWHIYKADNIPAKNDQTWAVYAAGDGWETADVSVSFDSGYVTTFTSISYSNSVAGRKAKIRTTGGTLYIGSSEAIAKGTIDFFGKAADSVVYAEDESFHSFGKVSKMDLEAGRAVSEEGGFIGLNKASAGTKAEQNGGIVYIPEDTVIGEGGINWTTEADVAQLTTLGYVTTVVDEKTVVQPTEETRAKNVVTISSKAELIKFREEWNNGSYASSMPVKLTADLNLSGEGWQPIGTIAHPFFGEFNGGDHTITGLTNNGYIIDTANIWTTTSTGHTGSAYGFFGIIGSRSGSENVSIHNIKFASVNIDVSLSNAVAAVAGADIAAAKKDAVNSYAGDLTFKNIEVKGTLIKGEDSIGAILGKSYTVGNIKVTDCVTDVTVRTDVSAKKIAGLVGYASLANSIYIKGNEVKGNVVFAGKATSNDVGNARNCVNMTVATGGRFGKNFVFGESVNTVSGKIMRGETQYLDPFTLAYTFDEAGNPTSATFNYISVGYRTEGIEYLDNNLVIFYDGSTVNGLYCNDGTQDNGKKDAINTFGTVVMNNCYVKGSYNSEVGGNLTLNNCSGIYVKSSSNYGTGSVTSSTGGLITINGGDYTLGNLQNCLSVGRSRITVTSGRFGDGYVAYNLPGSTYIASTWISSTAEVTHEGVTYSVARQGTSNVWVVTNAPAAE